MSPQELHARYEAEIDQRGRDDKYIDGIEERELLQIAVQHGFATEWARTFLTDVCRTKGYIIEAAVVQQIRDQLRGAIHSDGRLHRGSFETLVRSVKTALSGTTRNDREIRKLVATTVDDAGVPTAKTWWRFDWFRQLKCEYGL